MPGTENRYDSRPRLTQTAFTSLSDANAALTPLTTDPYPLAGGVHMLRARGQRCAQDRRLAAGRRACRRAKLDRPRHSRHGRRRPAPCSRVAETMSLRLNQLDTVLSANLITAGMILTASSFGVPVSTTHVSVGSISGTGVCAGTIEWPVLKTILLS